MAFSILCDFPSTNDENYIYWSVLFSGLFILTPLLSKIISVLSVSVPYPSLIGVSLIGIVYIFLLYWSESQLQGIVISLVFLSTIALKIPLTEPYIPLFSSDSVAMLSGHQGPKLFAFQIPLVILLFISIWKDWYRKLPITSLEIIFGCFVIWIFVSTIFADATHLSQAVWFGIFMLQGWLAFSILTKAIQSEILTSIEAIHTLVISLLGHILIGVIQFINQSGLGFNYLGGNGFPVVTEVNRFGFSIGLGLFVSGFTDFSYIFASLLVLFTPVILGLSLQYIHERKGTIASLILVPVMGLLVRSTTSDSARGAFLISTGVFILLGAWFYRDLLYRTIIWKVVGGLTLACGFILTPSEMSHQSATSTSSDSSTTGNGSSNMVPTENSSPDSAPIENGSSVSTPINDGAPDPSGAGSSPAEGVTATPIQVPLFDTSHLGTRIHQYLASFDLFLQHPLFGIGAMNFKFISPQYGIESVEIHNIYLSLLAGTGLIGVGLYLSSVISAVVEIWKDISISDSPILLIGILSGVAGYLAFGMLDPSPIKHYTSFLPFWFLLSAATQMVDDGK
ncbi:O-antigen ligase family protein [Natrinema altunense]|uniref:O-antigen ligase family protein n=1 Tax=Natrinema altunense TaxID=222984 RepID=UPI000A8C5EEC|nr:O-antigen ligase family protein [Natrinema altunense]